MCAVCACEDVCLLMFVQGCSVHSFDVRVFVCLRGRVHMCAVRACMTCAHVCAVWHRPILRPWAHSSQLSLPPASCGWESTELAWGAC